MRAMAVIRLIAATIMLLGSGTALVAQTGAVSGRVFDAETGSPLAGASVQVLQAGDQVAGGSTNDSGEFRFDLAPGSYSVVVTLLGYATRRMDVRVGGGDTEEVSVALASQAVELNPIVVSASREEEKALQAPADIVVVDAEQIAERPAPTVIEHVKALPGVDVAQAGLQQAAIVTRGFSNVFSGALLVITDNRYAAVPSLRVNVYSFIPVNNHDLDRIEVVLGPGAALYGPNAANGVMHMLTTSPIDVPGTTFSIAGGERSVLHAEFRTAHRGGSEKWGVRVSGQYFRGDDWEFVDPSEKAARDIAVVGDPGTKVGLRDFEAERFNTDVRIDLRAWEDGEVILSGGLSQAGSQIELTGIGAAQALDWRYTYGQARMRWNRLFVQGFANFSNAGDTYLLRTGQPIVDESRLLAAQVQHGTAVGSRLDFIYGIDLQQTEPRTDNTITGRNEDDDTINEVGGYLHAEAGLTDKLRFVGAVRVDDHSELEDVVWSPRAAVVFEPVTDQNFRATFNRAFGTPTTNNLFLDLVAGRIPVGPVGFDVRTRGTPQTGFTFARDCPSGFGGGLCMFSPFAPGRLPANASLAWNALLPLIVASVPDPVQRGQLQALLPALQNPGAAVGTVLRRFDPERRTFVLDPTGPQDIERLRPTITNTYEIGYKGLLGNRVLLSGDVYRSDIEDFIGPLRVETPTVFVDPATAGAFIVTRLAPIIGQAAATATAQLLAAGIASVPIGTVSPEQDQTSDLLLAYRNFGDFDLWGADVAAEILATDKLTVGGSFSYVSEECFDENNDDDCSDATDIALNSPQHKAALMARWDDDVSGWTIGGRGRFVSGFPMNSGVFIGTIKDYFVFDANVGYRIPQLPGTQVSLQVYNLFDEEHQEFIGAPDIGRLAMLRILYAIH
jgi:outer membrane receptor for ferrienterochelin and colicins